MTIKDYEQIRERLDRPSSIVLGDAAAFLHPLEPEESKGWRTAVTSRALLLEMLARMSRREYGSALIEVCLRTAVEKLDAAYQRYGPPITTSFELSFCRGNLAYCFFERAGYPHRTDPTTSFSFDYSKKAWKKLISHFRNAIPEVMLDVELARQTSPEDWTVTYWSPKQSLLFRLEGVLGQWITHWSCVYSEVTSLPQKEYMQDFWKHCQCRCAVRLGKKLF